MTTDTDALTGTHDLIVNAIWNAANGRPIPFNPDDLAAAVLPIVAEEVRRAKAEALRAWALGVESELDASSAHGIDLGEWGRGLRSGVRQALQAADRIEQEERER